MSMAFVSMNLVTMFYLIASVCFIQALKGLSHPSSARRGNVFGMSGMAIAAITTIALIIKLKTQAGSTGLGFGLLLIGLLAGCSICALPAERPGMTHVAGLLASI